MRSESQLDFLPGFLRVKWNCSSLFLCTVRYCDFWLTCLNNYVHVQQTAATLRNSVWMNPLHPECFTSENFPMKYQRQKSLHWDFPLGKWPTYWCWRGKTRYTLQHGFMRLLWSEMFGWQQNVSSKAFLELSTTEAAITMVNYYSAVTPQVWNTFMWFSPTLDGVMNRCMFLLGDAF